MNLEWTKNLKTEEEKKDFQKTLRNSILVFTRLRDIIRERKKQFESKEIDLSVYDSPSWAAKQAHLNGSRGELQFIEKLLSFLDDKES